MLGLPDLYARPENPGIGRRRHLVRDVRTRSATAGRSTSRAWCKEQARLAQADASSTRRCKQKLILAPIERLGERVLQGAASGRTAASTSCWRTAGRRASTRACRREGLLIWRVVDGRPVLEESHGVEGPTARPASSARCRSRAQSNNAFTPYTTPSSSGQLGGGLPVHITNIRRLPDGRITFHIGYEYQ